MIIMAEEINMSKHVNGSVLKAFGAKMLEYENGITDTIDEKVDTLIGDDAFKSVRNIANEELANQLIPENAQESLDTLKEIAEWIQNHPYEASAMNAAISKLEGIVTGIGGSDDTYKTVTSYVTNAVSSAQSALNAEVNKKVDKVEGKSLVDDTEITKLSGVSANANHTEVSATLTEGVEVGTITIDGIATKLYVAPTEYLTISEAEAIFNELIAPTA